ncbi:hypothetical protein ElyMa_004055500 [Elysia marginata]|uniref:Uncharacterized protein n=1 Tax=Elysia marginata TaxID=1093978 RepID=A0AAV4G5M9_9GAST|nr:hypothetical protein ElyMa_004055500 [Elysia marginata]
MQFMMLYDLVVVVVVAVVVVVVVAAAVKVIIVVAVVVVVVAAVSSSCSSSSCCSSCSSSSSSWRSNYILENILISILFWKEIRSDTFTTVINGTGTPDLWFHYFKILFEANSDDPPMCEHAANTECNTEQNEDTYLSNPITYIETDNAIRHLKQGKASCPNAI